MLNMQVLHIDDGVEEKLWTLWVRTCNDDYFHRCQANRAQIKNRMLISHFSGAMINPLQMIRQCYSSGVDGEAVRCPARPVTN